MLTGAFQFVDGSLDDRKLSLENLTLQDGPQMKRQGYLHGRKAGEDFQGDLTTMDMNSGQKKETGVWALPFSCYALPPCSFCWEKAINLPVIFPGFP